MASAKRAKSKLVKERPDNISRDNVDDHIASFLAQGGKIQEIPLGVSGQVATSGPRHITLGKRHST